MKWEPAHLWTRGLDLIMTKFPSGSHSLWLYFQVPTSGLKLGPASDRSGSRGERDRVSRTPSPWHDCGAGVAPLQGDSAWLTLGSLCQDWRACSRLVSWGLKTLHRCLLWAIDKQSSQMPAARCWGARVVRAKHVAWIFSEQVILRQAPTGSLPQARANLRLPGCMADGEGFDAGGEGEGWEPPLAQLACCGA